MLTDNTIGLLNEIQTDLCDAGEWRLPPYVDSDYFADDCGGDCQGDCQGDCSGSCEGDCAWGCSDGCSGDSF